MSEYGTQFFKPKQLELNDKMDLASYLLKPVQRMGKYALLLQQLMKACANVQVSHLSNFWDSWRLVLSSPQNITNQQVLEDLDELQKAEEMVRFQLRHGNDLLAMDSLRDCDVNVKEQGRLLRQSEFLVWEGKAGKKCLRQVFLFEELVLFSKARRFPDRKVIKMFCIIFLLITNWFWFNPNRIWTFIFTKTVLKRQTLVWLHILVTHRINLRFGSGKWSPVTLGLYRQWPRTSKTRGPRRFLGCCGNRPQEIEKLGWPKCPRWGLAANRASTFDLAKTKSMTDQSAYHNWEKVN